MLWVQSVMSLAALTIRYGRFHMFRHSDSGLFSDDKLVIYLSFAILCIFNSLGLLVPLFSCAVVAADRETLEVLDSFLV